MNLLINLKSLVVLDPLALFFLAVILMVSLPSLIFSLGYFKGKFTTLKLFTTQIITLGFIASMLCLVIVSNALVFLVIWEIMTLLSYLLVLTDSEKDACVDAATIYIVMTHCGTAFLMAAFFLIFKHAGSFDLPIMAAACQTMSPLLRNCLFICFLLGFGTKAGIVPLHIWLPLAHPQAPSHISSLMSGVMIKTAIYGLIRFVFIILGVSSVWWGATVIFFAIISCLAGILYALMEQDLKRLLAYSSVENIGIILLSLGLAMILTSLNLTSLAGLAMIATLYHLINHAAFKGLLFLCAGSIQKATNTLDLEKMGGLIKRMPWTALFFLIGAMGISALPPLNGFVSEWLILQTFFLGTLQVPLIIAVVFSISIVALALTSGLAAACFVKAFGIAFLALPRSQQAEQAKESRFSMLIGMGLLAIAVIGLGLAAPLIFNLLAKVAAFVCKAPFLAINTYVSPVLITFTIFVIMSITLGLYFLVANKNKRIGSTWDCGYYRINSRNEYTAKAFSKPFRISYGFFLMPFRKTRLVKESIYHIKSFEYETNTTKIFKEYLYTAGLNYLLGFAKTFKKVQAGSIHLYISYILITLVLLILLVKVF